MDILKKVQEKFPNHKVGVVTITDKNFKPYKQFTVDDKKVDYKFNMELAQDLAVFEFPGGIEDVIAEGICKEIRVFLNEER